MNGGEREPQPPVDRKALIALFAINGLQDPEALAQLSLYADQVHAEAAAADTSLASMRVEMKLCALYASIGKDALALEALSDIREGAFSEPGEEGEALIDDIDDLMRRIELGVRDLD